MHTFILKFEGLNDNEVDLLKDNIILTVKLYLKNCGKENIVDASMDVLTEFKLEDPIPVEEVETEPEYIPESIVDKKPISQSLDNTFDSASKSDIQQNICDNCGNDKCSLRDGFYMNCPTKEFKSKKNISRSFSLKRGNTK